MRASFRNIGPIGVLCLGGTLALIACSAGSDPTALHGARGPSTGAPSPSTSPPTPAPIGQPVPLEPPPPATGGADAGSADAPKTDIVVRLTQGSTASSGEAGFASAPVGTRILFLNRNGGTYYPGIDNSSQNTSSILAAAVNAPPWSRSDAAWQALLAGTKAAYAPYDVVVTDQDPGAVPHVEVLVSGSPTMFGQPSWTAGISPMAPAGSVVERAVCFVFDAQLQGTDDQVRVVTHEAAHAYGLDHELYCPDTMSYLFDCGVAKHFLDAPEYCGEYQARTCASGAGTQDSVQLLRAALGPSRGAPPPPPADAGATTGTATIKLGSPDDGATATGNGALDVTADVTGAQKVVLEWHLNGTVQTYDCSAMPQGMSCTQSGARVTWTLNVGTGPRSWRVKATDANGVVTASESRAFVLVDKGTSGGAQVAFTSPADGAAFNAGDNVTVNIDTGATPGVNAVWLTWTAPTAQVQYPLTYLGGSTWGLNVSTSAGAVLGGRRLTATAYDAGNNALAQTAVTIRIQ